MRLIIFVLFCCCLFSACLFVLRLLVCSHAIVPVVNAGVFQYCTGNESPTNNNTTTLSSAHFKLCMTLGFDDVAWDITCDQGPLRPL